MSKIKELSRTSQKFCRDNGIWIGDARCMKIASKIVKRMEHERRRLERMEITTTDGFSFIDYKDPTGESAVQNIMREIMASTPKVA